MADNGYWWCHDCSEEVAPSRVTSSEFHDSCGHPCEWIEAKSVLLVERLRSELAKAKADLATSLEVLSRDVGYWKSLHEAEVEKNRQAYDMLGVHVHNALKARADRAEAEYEVISQDYSTLKVRWEDAEILAKERGSQIVGLSCELENRTRQFENEITKVRAFWGDLCQELCQPDGSPDEQWAHNELCVDMGLALSQDTKTCRECWSRGLKDCEGVGHKPRAARAACPGRVCLGQDEFYGLRTALKERDELLAASKLALRAFHATASDKARYCLNDDDDAEPYLISKADVAGYRAIRGAISAIEDRSGR